MKRTGVVICNYNKKEDVIKCIQSVLESDTDDMDIFVVDNASTDASCDAIREHFADRVTLLVNKENLGGSGGFNTGIRHAMKHGYEYIWCLDNDTLVDEHALSELVKCLDTHADIGMVGSRVYHMSAPDFVQQNGITVDYDNFCVEARYFNYLEDGTLPELVYSDAVAACSVLVRRSLIEQIGPLPEENFLYWDDTEWGVLCNNAGFKVATCGTSHILHAYGAKREAVNTFPTYYSYRNQIRFFMMNTPEDKLFSMTCELLTSIFNVLYEGMFREEPNKGKTVMFAFDDAIHNVTGKAPDKYYLDMEHTYRELDKLIETNTSFIIITNGYDDLAQDITTKIQKSRPDASIEHFGDEQLFLEKYNDLNADRSNGIIVLNLCYSIFEVKDSRLKYAYVDLHENVFRSDEDLFYVANYGHSLGVFLLSHQPLFMDKTKELRVNL
ncbi:MAG: glycosyltransferase family 2 protein [Lachnospiraceae bacterium]|nr:glycosyltransferase family 2 protein [Lachnospiraceae bacterium]